MRASMEKMLLEENRVISTMIGEVNHLSCYQGPDNMRQMRVSVGTYFERNLIDVAGPFPTTTSNNKYILVAIDYSSMWPESRGITFRPRKKF